jgi:hypothetical protein
LSWPRQVTVTIGGTDHTAETIDSVFIQRGRRSYWESFAAGYTSIVLVDPSVRPTINMPVHVDVALSTTGTVRVFSGFVQSVTAQLDPNVGTLFSVQAFGPLARAGRRDQTDTLPQQLDGARVRSLLEDALNEQWAEQPLSQQWGQVDPTATWASYGIDTSIIDAGLYTLAPITQVPAQTFSELGLAAFSGGGNVYETGDGRVGYADSTRRQGASLGAPVVLNAGQIAALSATATEAREDLVNQTNLTWSGGLVTFTAADSVAEYGFVVRDYQTILDDVGDAAILAERLVALQAFPAPVLEGPILVRLNNIPDLLTDQLLGLNVNDYLELDAIPTSVLPAGTFLGFVEGINFELTNTFANVELFASDQKFSIYETRWADIPDTATWGDVVATLQWQDA